MEGKVVISVVICTYNQEEFIASAIESALNQVVDAPYEILVGDDCSTDHTRDVVERYYENNKNKIRMVFPDANLGSTHNLLRLVEASKGDYIAILDGDDVWLDSNKLQKQFDVLNGNSDVGMVCSMAKVWDEKRQCYSGVGGNKAAEEFFEMIKEDNDVMAPTMFFRKKLFYECVKASGWYIDNNCFFDTIVAYWFAYYSKIVVLPEVLALYRVLPNSGCHTDDQKKQREYDKRYFDIKVRFLLENDVPVDAVYDILLKEWDKVYDNAAWRKECEVRNSKSYRLGNKVIGLFGELNKQ